MIEFTDEEIAFLSRMLEDWVSEGFQVAPFKQVVYDIANKLKVEV